MVRSSSGRLGESGWRRGRCRQRDQCMPAVPAVLPTWAQVTHLRLLTHSPFSPSGLETFTHPVSFPLQTNPESDLSCHVHSARLAQARASFSWVFAVDPQLSASLPISSPPLPPGQVWPRDQQCQHQKCIRLCPDLPCRTRQISRASCTCYSLRSSPLSGLLPCNSQ